MTEQLITEAEEREWFDYVREVVSERIALRRQEKTQVSEELSSLQKMIATSRGDMDGLERQALRQMAAMDDLRKRAAGESLTKLLRMAASPYYGRVDFRPGDGRDAHRVYIGIVGLHDGDGRILVHDWRAPISSLFYDYEAGPAEYEAPSGSVAGDILLKRQYRIENGEIVYILDSSVAITDSILRDALAQNATAKMRQVAGTIQREQNRIIRDERHRVLVVQGIAGSGKTSVALHRAAYLLFRHRDSITSRNLLVFSPNQIFSDYIANVLPELGEENILQVVFDDYTRSMLGGKLVLETKYEQLEYLCGRPKDAEYHGRARAIAFKASAPFLETLSRYARGLKEEAWTFRDIEHSGQCVVPADEMAEIFREYCASMPVKAARKRVAELVALRYAEAAPAPVLRGEARKMVRVPNPVSAYYALLSSPERLQEMSDGKLSAEDAAAVCAATTRRRPDRAVLYEDIAPMLLLTGHLEGFPQDRRIAHVVVDEAQDYTVIQYEVLRRIFTASSWTILGDANQLVNPCLRTDGFQCVEGVFAGLKPVLLKLHTSYRASHELTEFTKHMSVIADATYATTRVGHKPVIKCSRSAAEIPGKVARDVQTLHSEGYQSVAVICKSAAEAQDAFARLDGLCDLALLTAADTAFRAGTVVLPVYLAKGLEFDAVILYDSGKHNYGDRSEQELLYTACTRALHRLHLHYSGEPSPLLPMEHGDLYESR